MEEERNDTFDYIDKQETKEYFSSTFLIEQSKIKNLEQQGKITLKEKQGFENNITKKFVNLISRRNILYYGIMCKECQIQTQEAKGNLALSLIDDQEISKQIEKMPEKHKERISYIHISKIQIIIKSTYLKGIESPIKIAVIDNRIKSNKERIIGVIEGNLKYSVIKFNVSLHYALPIKTKNFNNSIGIEYKFERQGLFEKEEIPFVITYAIGYALSNSIHSIEFTGSERIEIDKLFKDIGTKFKVITQEEEEKEGNKFIKPNLNKSQSLRIERPLNFIVESPKKTLERQITELRQEVNNIGNRI